MDEDMLYCVALAAFRNKRNIMAFTANLLNYDKDGVDLIYRPRVVSCMKSVQSEQLSSNERRFDTSDH